MLQSYTGGPDIDKTIIWCGRFIEAASHKSEAQWLTRAQVKKELLGTFDKKKGSPDTQIRSRMVVVWGDEKTKEPKVKGQRQKGIAAHAWQALGLATAWMQINERTNGVTTPITRR